MNDQSPDPDASFVGVPASSIPELHGESPGYLAAEGPEAVRKRASKLAGEHDDDLSSFDRSIKYLFFVIVVFAIVLGVPITQSVENSYHNCLDSKAFAVAYNGYLDAQVRNVLKSPLLTPEQKAERVAQADHFHAYNPRHCTGVWPFQP